MAVMQAVRDSAARGEAVVVDHAMLDALLEVEVEEGGGFKEAARAKRGLRL